MKLNSIFIVIFAIFNFSCSANSDIFKNLSPEDVFEDPNAIALAAAIRNNDINRMETLLREGIDVNKYGKDKITFLMWAYGTRSFDAFQLLLKNGADPTIPIREAPQEGYQPWTVIFFTVRDSEVRWFKELLDNGLDVEFPAFGPPYGHTVLHEAISVQNYEHIKLLLEAGADPNKQDNLGNTALRSAHNVRNYKMILLLIEYGADPGIKSNIGKHLGDDVLMFKDRGIMSDQQYEYYLKLVSILQKRGLLPVNFNPDS